MNFGKTVRSFFGMTTALVLLASLSGCNDKSHQPNINTNVVTDYSVSSHWLSLPVNLMPVDVFYAYPTSWYKTSPSDPNVCAVDLPMMLVGARKAFSRQATTFEAVANVYAPYYRQVDGDYTLALPENQRWALVRKYPAQDIIAAFEYYIAHFNQGRPFILAGHSQGSNALLVLLSDYMSQHPEVQKRMIAAYIIGYPVTESFMQSNPHLKFATGPDDIGVIISYNTQSPKVKPGTNPVVGNNIGLVINPITWTRDTSLAPASQSLGSFIPDSTGHFVKVLNFADAKIDLTQGVLICSSVNDSAMYRLSGSMGLGVYHSFDYPFYYYNLQENAGRRINKFLSHR